MAQEGSLRIEHLHKAFGDNVVLEDVSFEVEPGEVIVPNKGNKPKKSSTILSWIRQKSHQVGEAAEGAFDSTMGSLFDDMK